MSDRQAALEAMDRMGISYELAEHPAVYTIEEMERVPGLRHEVVAKNLFVRDDKKRQYFLIVLPGDRQANLQHIREQLGCRRLSFASEQELTAFLGLTKGAVTPLGVLNDTQLRVEVVFDERLRDYPVVGVHPNDNTATVFLRFEDLEGLVKAHGNPVKVIRLD